MTRSLERGPIIMKTTTMEKISSKEIPEEMTCLKERIQATRQVQAKKRHK